MADLYRRLLDKKTGSHGGGIKCDCCNWSKSKYSKSRKRGKTKMAKIIRQILKRNIIDEIYIN